MLFGFILGGNRVSLFFMRKISVKIGTFVHLQEDDRAGSNTSAKRCLFFEK